MCFFFFKQKTAYEMRISDWSSDVCSSDLNDRGERACPRTSQTTVAAGAIAWRREAEGILQGRAGVSVGCKIPIPGRRLQHGRCGGGLSRYGRGMRDCREIGRAHV